MTTVPQQPQPGLVGWIDQNRRLVSHVLFGVAVVLVVLAPLLWWKFTWDVAKPWVTFCALLGLAAGAAGAWIYQSEAGGPHGRDSARLFLLSLGGALGAVLLFSTLWQTRLWWALVIGGTATWQDKANWYIWLLPVFGLVGVALIFASLLLVRGQEDSDPRLRRALYGYNAVLTGLLLLAILAIFNVLASLYLPPSSDWTAKGIYTLSSQSENVLKGLDQPVKVYVLIEDRGTRFVTEVRDLLDNCRSSSDKLAVEYLVRDINVDEVDRLARKYNLPDSVGLLVVYGSGDQESYQFIRRDEMYQQQAPRMDAESAQRGPTFKGEDSLISTLLFLEERKKEPVVYFTQGEGELDLFGGLEGAKPDRTARSLLSRLEKSHYKVKGLRLEAGAAKSEEGRVVAADSVPDDAAVVVVAGPRKEFSSAAVTALRKYMTVSRKEKDPADPSKERDVKGKLYVLLDVVAGSDEKIQPTGLESLLAEFEVDASNQRVLRVRGARPDQLAVMTNPNLRERNPLAANFTDPLAMSSLRMVQPRGGQQRPAEMPGRFQTDVLMQTVTTMFQGSEVFTSDSMRSPELVQADFLKLPREEQQQRKRASVPVAVTVSEPSGAADPMDPHAAMRGGRGDGSPRLVVLGDSKFASDLSIAGGRGERDEGGSLAYELFANSIAWLREKPSSIGISPKDRGVYKMKDGTDVDRMISMPFYLMTLGIVGLGLGVWVVRRR